MIPQYAPNIAAACRNYVLAANLTAPFVLRARDFATGPSATGTYLVFDYFNVAAGGATLDDSHPFLIPTGTAQPSAPVTAVPLRYYVAAPVLPGGWVLYGEAGKVVPMAAKRTSGLVASAAGFSVEVRVGGRTRRQAWISGSSLPEPVCPWRCIAPRLRRPPWPARRRHCRVRVRRNSRETRGRRRIYPASLQHADDNFTTRPGLVRLEGILGLFSTWY